MHASAYQTGKNFFSTYASEDRSYSVVEIGSQNLNGSLRDVTTKNVVTYTGLDFSPGNGVDIVLEDPYRYPIDDSSYDILVTSSCFEHSEMFWLSFLEGMRVLKDDGIMYINAPSAWMMYHRYPVDCWRFWPDAGKALETWAKYSGLNSMVLESYVTPPGPGEFVADFVCVMLKNRDYVNNYKHRIIDNLTPKQEFFNGFRFPETDKFPYGWKVPSVETKQDVIQFQNNQFYIR